MIVIVNIFRSLICKLRKSKSRVQAVYDVIVIGFHSRAHCQISYRGGLGTGLCIMRYGTQHPHSQKEHTELYKILKCGVNQANIRRDTAIQKLKKITKNYTMNCVKLAF